MSAQPNKTSWEQFNETSSLGVIITVAVIAGILFPPLLLVYAFFGIMWVFSKFGDNAPAAKAVPIEDGWWRVFDKRGNMIADHVSHEQAMHILKGQKWQ